MTFRQKKIWPQRCATRFTVSSISWRRVPRTEFTEDDVKAKVSWVVKKAERLGLSMDDETARDHLTEAITVANRSTKK